MPKLEIKYLIDNGNGIIPYRLSRLRLTYQQKTNKKNCMKEKNLCNVTYVFCNCLFHETFINNSN